MRLIGSFLLLAICGWGEGIDGIWSGTLETAIKLRLVLRVKTEAGKMSASLQSVDQGVTLPVSEIGVNGKVVSFSVAQVGGSFQGVLGGAEINGMWSQMGADLPLVLRRTTRAPQADRPQEPKAPFPYQSLDVTYKNAAARVKLAGTLTVPKGAGPFPAVVLISGSGPQDRNETIVGHKPFWVIADYLTRRGVAVLRFDDRGVGQSTGDGATATLEDTASDVEAGVEFLRSRAEIDDKRIGLVGHSEGGAVAPLVASRGKGIAFLVLMAAPGATGEQLLYAQSAAMARSLGSSPMAIAGQQALQKKLFAIVKEGGDPAGLEERLQKAIDEADGPAHAQDAAGEHAQHEAALKAVARSQMAMLLAPGLRYFLTYDPVPALKAVKCPVLVLNGERDTQVPAWQNLPMIVAALEAGENAGYRVEKFAGLNHLFQKAETGAVIEYAQIPETISPRVLEVMGEWIGRAALKH